MMQDTPRVAYVVLPPGHGKSHNHLRWPGLVEADTLVPCRSTQLLSQLRDQARSGGSWVEYDKEWVRLLSENLPDGRVVVMLPSREVGEASGWVCLGSAVLEMAVWSQNFSTRKKGILSFISTYNDLIVNGARIFPSNEELATWLERISQKWVTCTD